MDKITYLDSYTLNPGDLSWAGLENLGELQTYERTPPHEVVERCKDTTILLTNKVQLSAEILSQLPKLKLIGVTATGFDIVDTQAARKQGISVVNVPGYGTEAVAQHTWAMLLELTNRVGEHANSTAAGNWSRNPDWCYWKSPIVELKDKNLGIVGLGKIGSQVARIGRAMGMRLWGYTPAIPAHTDFPITWSDMPTIFSQADVISLHCPLTAKNQGFVNSNLLTRMKPSALLINTSRGGLINEPDLAKALKQGKLAGAALDVLSAEPPPPDHPLIGLPNCLITPHQAWAAKESRQRLLKMMEENIRAFQTGLPLNVVN